MSNTHDNPYARLERIFHEPGRLTIMSNLLGAIDGLTFTELKEACELTDGNLSRHLSALENAKAVHIKKSFAGSRPQTTISLSKQGREDFMAYLQALEAVLLDAAEKVAVQDGKPAPKRTLFSTRLANA
ncbi:MAG: transcriptional regulator [Sedimentisphaerales bacterium]|nr:transcriptional regulator [Sedimentisphaerales bacterium]